MSDTVALALIAMIQSWGDALASNLHLTLPAAGTALIAFMNWRYNKKAEERAEALNLASDARAKVIAAKVAEVEAAAITSTRAAELMAKGAERRGVEIGIEAGVEQERKRASDFSTLQSNFSPESTDVFMVRTDPKR